MDPDPQQAGTAAAAGLLRSRAAGRARPDHALPRFGVRRSHLHRSRLHRPRHRADLHRTDLHRADVHRARLRGADLHGARLRGAGLHRGPAVLPTGAAGPAAGAEPAPSGADPLLVHARADRAG
ncbi:pentapeptide repeat-containing protein [Nocardioides sp. URHA0020]|uniref:pentapeptide repeat-containing protein n=1 Tax=Nocardioides sp. URHA0020 TaxID=1380392 RepID=UPI003FA5AD0C